MSQFENFVAMVEGWTVEERGRVLALLEEGKVVAAAVSTPVKTVAAKKVAAPKAPVKKAMPSKPLPEGVPTAADYRLTEADIDVSVCLGRVFDAEPDKRFRPAVYQEGQCGGAPVEGCDLCVTCQRRMTKYAATVAAAGVEKPGPWLGRVTEDPMPWSNMLDSAKMLAKPPKWVADGGSDAGSAGGGSEAPASEGGAESEGAEQMPLSSSSSSAPVAVGGAGAPSKPVKLSAAEKAAALADKAKVAAEKAAAALAKKEAAEAKKAAAEAKKAEKAAAPKPAPKAAAKKAAAPAPSVVVSAAASSAEPKEADGEFDMLDGELRFVRNGNVYEFDAMTEKVGCFLGRKTADGTIDADAEEVGAAEAE